MRNCLKCVLMGTLSAIELHRRWVGLGFRCVSIGWLVISPITVSSRNERRWRTGKKGKRCVSGSDPNGVSRLAPRAPKGYKGLRQASPFRLLSPGHTLRITNLRCLPSPNHDVRLVLISHEIPRQQRAVHQNCGLRTTSSHPVDIAVNAT